MPKIQKKKKPRKRNVFRADFWGIILVFRRFVRKSLEEFLYKTVKLKLAQKVNDMSKIYS